MTPQEIKIGTRFEFEMLNNRDEKVGNTFVTQLLEHQSDSSIVISAPISESRVIFVPTGITIRLTFVHNLNGLLGLRARVRSKEIRGNIAVLIAEPDQDIEKIQRREHYRLDVITDALIWPVVEDIESVDPENGTNGSETQTSGKPTDIAPIKAYTRNLSGSGCCVICDTSYPKNTELMIELDLTDNIVFRAKCVILRCEIVEVKRGKSYELGMRFTEISSRDQDNLIRYIFEQQRKLLKKEK